MQESWGDGQQLHLRRKKYYEMLMMAEMMTAALSMVVRLLVRRLRIMLMTAASRQTVMVPVVRTPTVTGTIRARVVMAIVRKAVQRTYLRRMNSLMKQPVKKSVKLQQTAPLGKRA